MKYNLAKGLFFQMTLCLLGRKSQHIKKRVTPDKIEIEPFVEMEADIGAIVSKPASESNKPVIGSTRLHFQMMSVSLG